MARREPLPGWVTALIVGGIGFVALATWRQARQRNHLTDAAEASAPLPEIAPRRAAWVAEDGTMDVAALLRLLNMPAPSPEAALLSRPQQAALDDWNDTVYLGRELAPPTERQVAAMASFGMRINETTPFRAASAALSARDYALTLTERTPEHESDLEIRMLAGALLHHEDLHNKLIAWSWHTRDQDPRRVPKDALRAWCEMFLSRIPS